MKEVKDIQTILNEKTEKECKTEFSKDIGTINAILNKYMREANSVETEEFRKELTKSIQSYGSGSLFISGSIRVPACYVRERQSMASKKLLDAIQAIQEQVSDLDDIINNLSN